MKKKFIIFCLAILSIVFYIYFYNKNEKIVEKENKNIVEKENKNIVEKTFKIEEELVDINKYYIYGTHLNIEGALNINNKDSITNAEIVLYNKEIEYSYNITHVINDTLEFSISEKINEGINLEELKVGEYFILLKISTANDYFYYSFINNSKLSELKYYSFSKDNLTNEISILTNRSFEDKPSFNIIVKEIEIPKDVYDIIIDPGHGGKDVGAVSNKYYERDLNLQYAKKLKEKLDSFGYKVALTRSNNTDTMYRYGKNSQINKIYESKAKLLLSLHLNSTPKGISLKGIEIYAPNNTNLNFAKSIADNIKKTTNAEFSNRIEYKILDGVFVRNFEDEDILEVEEELKNLGKPLYENLNTSTTYYYILRETGGIITNAYVDGRNPKYKANDYINSYIAPESYLIEFGFMNHNEELLNLINNKDDYILGLTNAINNKYKNTSY